MITCRGTAGNSSTFHVEKEIMMRTPHRSLKALVFMALCCVLALFSKRLISPATNFLTDLLRIPGGGVSAGIGFCFLLVGSSLSGWAWAASAMGLTQGLLALALGMAGNQGLLAPITYMVPGIVIDLTRLCFRKHSFHCFTFMLAGIFAAGCNAASSSLLVFHFRGFVLFLWLITASFAGAIGGLLAWLVSKKLPVNG